VGVPVRERGGLAGPCSVTLSGLSRLSTVEVAHIDLLGTVRSLKVESVAVERHGRPTFASSTNSIVGCGIVNIPHEQHAIQEQPAVPPGLQKHNRLARIRRPVTRASRRLLCTFLGAGCRRLLGLWRRIRVARQKEGNETSNDDGDCRRCSECHVAQGPARSWLG